MIVISAIVIRNGNARLIVGGAVGLVIMDGVKNDLFSMWRYSMRAFKSRSVYAVYTHGLVLKNEVRLLSPPIVCW